MSENYQYILVERDEQVGIVTLNRPKELNALNFQIVAELSSALDTFDRDETIRCMVITGAGGTQRLARTLGKFVAMEMVLAGKQFTAQEMAAHGLVNRVVPKGEHLSEALKLAKEIAAKAPLAARLAKESVLAAFETSLEEGLERERKNFFLLFATEDMREGMQAFVEKRSAKFQGK